MAIVTLKAKPGLICLLFFAPLLFPSVAKSGLPDLDQVISNLQATYEGIQDLQARFYQISRHKSSGGMEESGGILLMKKPGMMRWEYKSPEARLIVSDGTSLYIYSPADRQVIVQEAPQVFTSLVVNLLAGMGRLQEDFRIQWGKAEGRTGRGRLLLELKPIQPQGQVHLILMEIHPETFLVERIILKDAYSNTSIFSFKKVKVNTGLNESLFIFVPPPGTEVIKGLPGMKRP